MKFSVLGFDLDHTLIRPLGRPGKGKFRNGKKTRGPTFYAAASNFADGVEWEWTAPGVPQILVDLCARGPEGGLSVENSHAIWIATSQRWKPGAALDAALLRVERVASILRGHGLRVFVSVARRHEPHRHKPSPLLWEHSEAARAGGDLLWYCGDDDGVGGAGKGADILLARNCGVAFVPAGLLHGPLDNFPSHGPLHLPAQLGGRQRALLSAPSPVESARRYSSANLVDLLGLYFEGAGLARRDGRLRFTGDAAVLLAGAPGAGKSTLAAALRAAWGDDVLVHDETTPAVQAQVRRRKKERPGAPCVVVLDRTHPAAAARAAQLAAAGSPPAVLVLFTDFALAAELNRHRCVGTRGARFVPAVAESMFARRADFSAPRGHPEYIGVFRVHGVVDVETVNKKHLRFTAATCTPKIRPLP
jgi:hypothetical protein